MWKTVRDTRGDLLHPSYNTAAFFHNFFIIMMISKKSVGLLLVFFSLRIFPGQQQLNSFFHLKKRKNINDVGIINYKKERMHLPSSVWEWHCKRKVFSFFSAWLLLLFPGVGSGMAGHGRRAKDSIQGNWGIPGCRHGLCRCWRPAPSLRINSNHISRFN